MTHYTYHYVYLITNVVEQRYYVGARSTNRLPKDDLGIVYFSSSTDKNFLREQKEKPENFDYTVMRCFECRADAIGMEIFVHSFFDVARNNKFYNKAKQTNVSCDVTGVPKSLETRKKMSLSWKNGRCSSMKGVPKSLETREKMSLSWKTSSRISSMKGKKHTEETKIKMSQSAIGKPKSEITRQRIKKKRANQIMSEWTDARKSSASLSSHFRKNAGLSYETIYGVEKASQIKSKQAKATVERRQDNDAESKRKIAHFKSWVIKMSPVYRKIFKLFDEGKKQSEIVKILTVNVDTVRKAKVQRDQIESILNELI